MAYSKKVTDALKKVKAGEGDRVRVEKAGVVFEGVVLPKASEGSADALLLKLDSGYNVGVTIDDRVKMSKFDSPKQQVAALKEKPFAQKKGLPKIALIVTGGTITSKADYESGGVKTMLKPRELLTQFPELLKVVEVAEIVVPFEPLMSEDFDSSSWIAIAKAVESALKKADGVVVVQGTDSLGYSAAAVAFMLGSVNKPVLFTAAQRSADRGSFDGSLNLVCAAHFVSSG
ncbi:MAG: asparaginase domain-containing protein, partial [Candidatus Micrarchaeota archaeon]